MIPITMKKDMVELLGQVIREEGGKDNWDKLSFEEKLEFANQIMQWSITMLKNLEILHLKGFLK